MSNELYFISLISHALDRERNASALGDAFRRICELGKMPEYEQGTRQFEIFMEMIAEASQSFISDSLAAPGSLGISLLLHSGARTTTLLRLASGGAKAWSLEEAMPGHYQLVCDTGRVLWERDLADSDLIWTRGRPEQPLELAADTGEGVSQFAVEESLLGGAVLVRVCRGIENGRIEIQVQP